RTCLFKLDTGFDVCLVNRELVGNRKRSESIDRCRLIYPTGEEVPIRNKVYCQVQLGSFEVKMSMLVVDIEDECLLEADFFEAIGAERIFESLFGNSSCRTK
ncbi:hypothetical protein EAI_09440, partial [Harpegnathos saltator]